VGSRADLDVLREEKTLAPDGNRTQVLSPDSLVTVTTEISRLTIIINYYLLSPSYRSFKIMCGPGKRSQYSDSLRLDGPGIESRCGKDFTNPSRRALGPNQPPVQWVPGLFLGVKRPGRGVDHPPPSSAEVKEKVKLYLYCPSGPSWSVLG
jgi:hypothetical protein